MEIENNLALTVKSALPQLAGDITYNDFAKMFLTPGCVSQAGNMYQEGVRLSRRMAVKFSIGHGIYYTFLNGVQIYMWDGHAPKVVAQESFCDYRWNEDSIRRTLERMVKGYLVNQCKIQGVQGVSDSDLGRCAKELVGDMQQTTMLLGRGVATGTGTLSLKG